MRLVIALCVTLAATPAFADPNAFIDVTDPPLVTATVFGNPNLETAKCRSRILAALIARRRAS